MLREERKGIGNRDGSDMSTDSSFRVRRAFKRTSFQLGRNTQRIVDGPQIAVTDLRTAVRLSESSR